MYVVKKDINYIKDMKISVSLTDEETKILERLQELLKSANDSIKSKTDAASAALECAIDNKEIFEEYILKRLASAENFNPEKDGFTSIAFASTLVDMAKKNLKAGIMVNAGECRVLAAKNTVSELVSNDGSKHIKIQPGPEHGNSSSKQNKKQKDSYVYLDLEDIHKTAYRNLEDGSLTKYRYIPSEKIPSSIVVELLLKGGDKYDWEEYFQHED
jgi:hypothetical protein